MSNYHISYIHETHLKAIFFVMVKYRYCNFEKFNIVGAFSLSQSTPISFSINTPCMSVCLSLCRLSARISAAPSVSISVSFDSGTLY
jgi:hypothetical protein